MAIFTDIYAPDHNEVSVAGIGEEYQQLYDAFGHLKKLLIRARSG